MDFGSFAQIPLYCSTFGQDQHRLIRGLHFTPLETTNFLCYRVELDPTSKLGEFFEETKDDSPDVRAEKLEAHKAISEVHDEVAALGQTSVSLACM